MAEEIVNKVAQSGIEQIDLKEFIDKRNWLFIDLKDQLWNELVIREKDFRNWVKEHDWSMYSNHNVAIFCSNDAIVPAWAYMLVTAHMPEEATIYFGTEEEAKEIQFFESLQNWDISYLKDKRVMVKGCSDIPSPNRAYVTFTKLLTPITKSIMFGEPCSAVPVFKKK